jgi:hypothetical protein
MVVALHLALGQPTGRSTWNLIGSVEQHQALTGRWPRSARSGKPTL